MLKRVNLKNLKTGEIIPVDLDGCFLFIGYLPNTQLFENLVRLDSRGYILTNEEMETSQPGIFSAGDVRSKVPRQVATAVGDGAVAGSMAERYISDLDTIHSDILSKDKVLVCYYNASEENDRATLMKVETFARENNIEAKPVDIDKSYKSMKILGGAPLALSLYKEGKKAVTVSLKENFDLSSVKAEL